MDVRQAHAASLARELVQAKGRLAELEGDVMEAETEVKDLTLALDEALDNMVTGNDSA